MATRRSTRLKTLPVQQPADDNTPDVQVNAKGKGAQPRATKRAAATSNVADDGKGEPSRKKTKSKSNVSNAQLIGSVVGANDKFSTLPPECLNMVLDNIKAPTEMSALGRSSKTFYSLMMPRLYGRIAVAAMFHAHVSPFHDIIFGFKTIFFFCISAQSSICENKANRHISARSPSSFVRLSRISASRRRSS